MKNVIISLMLIVNATAAGCGSSSGNTNWPSESHFFQSLSLSDIITSAGHTLADCEGREAGAGARSEPKWLLFRRLSRNRSQTIDCKIDKDGNNGIGTIDFMQSLKGEIEKRVQSSGAAVKGQIKCSSNGIEMEYTEGRAKGKIKIEVMRSGDEWRITSSVDEAYD